MLKNKLRKWPVAYKLYGLLLPAFLVLIVLYSFLCEQVYQRELSSRMSTQIQTQFDAIAKQINNDISKINRTSFYLYGNLNVREGLEEALLSPDTFTLDKRLNFHNKIIDPAFLLINEPDRYKIKLYPISDKVYLDYSNIFPLSMFPEEIDVAELTEKGFGKIFYQLATVNRTAINQERALCITRVMYYPDKTVLGLISTEVYLNHYKQWLSSALPKGYQSTFQITMADGIEWFEEEGEEPQPSSRVFTSSLLIPKATMSVSIEDDFFAHQGAEQKILLLLLTIPLLLITYLAISLAVKASLARIDRVTTKFKSVNAQDKVIPVTFTGGDEAAKLDETFTQLYNQYQQSLESLYEEKEKQRLVESHLLLSKINPHFLYNTLSAVRWTVGEEAAGVIDQLVLFYRNVLGGGKEITTLNKEIEVINQYINLQRYTYSKNIGYDVDIHAAICENWIPAFTLQPVVENAIQYGFQKEQMAISISARLAENTLEINVWNSGKSIEKEMLSNLNSLNDLKMNELLEFVIAPDQRHGYAVFNIICRIRLLFGTGYGLWFKVPPKGGTCVTLRLPDIKDLLSLNEAKNNKKEE